VAQVASGKVDRVGRLLSYPIGPRDAFFEEMRELGWTPGELGLTFPVPLLLRADHVIGK